MKKCPICNSTNTQQAFITHGYHGNTEISSKQLFSYYQCHSCNSLFLVNVRINKQYYDKHYNFKGYQRENLSLKGKIEAYLERNTFARREKMILSFFPNKKRTLSILDVGCGNGKFLEYLDNHIFEKYGLELNENEYKLAKQKGIKVDLNDIETMNFRGKKFDVITLWHVVEHIKDPQKLFAKLSLLTKNNGIIIFATPNPESIGFCYGKEHWFHTDAPRHLVLLPPKAVMTLLYKNSLKIKKTICEHIEFPLDLFWSLRFSKMKFIVYPFYPIVKFITRETLTYIVSK